MRPANNSTSLIFFITVPVLLLNSCSGPVSKQNEDKDSTPVIVEKTKIAAAISCAQGLAPNDSIVFMNGGGADFAVTIENKPMPSEAKPDGMVWIPGGEFSMGGVNPVGIKDGGFETMNDARPVHRVYVDGFYMDASEITNAEFTAFVKATNYITVAEKKPTKEEFPDAPE
jgi:sulfatase modifying factor 1